MARFDVYANPEVAERRQTPYFLDVQNDFIHAVSTRVVVPLRRESVFGPRARNLNPMVTISGENLVLDTAAIGAVPAQELRKMVAHLAGERAAVQDALDTLFGGSASAFDADRANASTPDISSLLIANCMCDPFAATAFRIASGENT